MGFFRAEIVIVDTNGLASTQTMRRDVDEGQVSIQLKQSFQFDRNRSYGFCRYKLKKISRWRRVEQTKLMLFIKALDAKVPRCIAF
jgi:hypothetical protein